MAKWNPPRRIASSPFGIAIQSGSPSWAPAAGEYADISLTTAYLTPGVDPCPGGGCPYTLVEGQSAMWRDWNGSVFVPDHGAFGSIYMAGGGHFGYVGNEVIRYDIESRAWSRLDNPSNYGWGKDGWANYTTAPSNVVDIYGSFPDGKPIPLHNYYNLVYVPPDAGGGTLGSIVFMHRDNSSSSNVTETPWWRYDIQTKTWTRGPQAIKQVQGPTGNQYVGLCYDPKRKGIWKLNRFPSSPSTGISFYSLVTGLQYDVPLNSGNSYVIGTPGCGVIAYNVARDFLLMMGENSSDVNYLVCADLSNYTLGTGFVPTHTIQQSGPTPACLYGSGYGSPFEYCPYDGNHWIVDWPVSSTLYRLAVPAVLTGTWTWTAWPLTPKSGTGQLAFEDRRSGGGVYYDNHLYTKFRYVPGIKSFLWTDNQSLKVQAGRPSIFT